MKRAFGKTLILISGLLFPLASAWADLLPFDEPDHSITVGPTTVTWRGSWQDLNYNKGDPITVAVPWTVVSGTAVFSSFDLKQPVNKAFTPGGVEGGFIDTTDGDPAQTATGNLTFSKLKRTGQTKKGNAHLHLILTVDSTNDGIDVPDLDVVLGVNVYVCDKGERCNEPE